MLLLAFLGGRDTATGKPLRVMMSGARVGFHQFGAKFDPEKTYSKKDMTMVVEDSHRVMDSIIGYLHAIGEDLAFLPLMLRAPHEAITLVNDDEALAFMAIEHAATVLALEITGERLEIFFDEVGARDLLCEP